jgi:hypothetical protein
MNFNIKKLLVAVSVISTIGFTACDEGGTIDIPGPDLNYTFTYTDINNQVAAPRSTNTWILIAEDSVKGKDLEAFLADSANQQYSDVVEAASLKNARLTVSGGDFDFTGVDSVKISYMIVGTTELLDMVIGTPSVTSADSIAFNDTEVTKEQVYQLIGSDAVIKLYAVFNPLTQNCFKPGAVYNFTANTVLSVKLAALAEGVLGVTQ